MVCRSWLREPPTGSYVVVEAGDLKKGSALRKVGRDAHVRSLTIACYSDDARSLQALIDKELGDEKLGITPAARERLMEALGGDRLASRNEAAQACALLPWQEHRRRSRM